DATISWSNYAAGNTGECAVLKLTGALTAAATLTFPAYNNALLVWNAAGAAVTIKCAAGTGVTLANGQRGLLFCDGTDYANAAPTLFPAGMTVAGQVSGVSAGTDAVNVTQLAAAIAASVPAGTAGTLFNSVADTTRDYLSAKITGSF